MVNQRSILNLRVRLKPHQRKALEEMAKEAGRQQTISTIVRQILEDFQSAKKGKIIRLSQVDHEKLINFSMELGRDPNTIVSECILAVEEMLKGKRAPLIVEELKLRRKYTQNKSVKAASI